MNDREFVEELRGIAVEAWATGQFFVWMLASAMLLGARIGGWIREGKWY